MDWVQTAITGGIVLAGHVGVHIANTARFGQRVETLEKDRDDHKTRLDGHDEELKNLPVKFVPRTELVASLDAIHQSQRRTERWMERILFAMLNGKKVDGGPEES